MALQLPTEVFGEVVVAHAPEELSEDQADALVSFLTGLQQSKVVLDLDGTETLDSGGLAALWDAHDALCNQGGALCITTANPTNRKILEITRLDQHLDVFESVIDAVRSFA